MSDKRKLKPCLWTYDDDFDYYDTSCGKSFVLTEGTLARNKMRFCCYCGNPIREER